MYCCCNCNPCLQYPCCNPVTTTTIPVPPEVTCEEVAACVKADLQNLVADEDNAIDNFCDASIKCVNEALYNIPLGGSELNNLAQAVYTVLRALPGYSNSQNKTLSVIGGVMQWIDSSNPSSTTIPPELIYYGVKLDELDTPTETEILLGHSIPGNGNANVTLNWGPLDGVPKYYWIAIAAGSLNRIKNKWYESPLNNGDMGGISDLFGPPATVIVNGINYNVWITNFLTELTANSYVFSRV